MPICKCGRNIPENAICFCDCKDNQTIIYSNKTINVFTKENIIEYKKEEDRDLTQLDYFRFLWKLLHTYKYSSEKEAIIWFNAWKEKIPCGDCRIHFSKILEDNPMDFSNKKAFFESGVKVHNLVNKRLNKEEFSLDQAISLYGFVVQKIENN